ncbi:MAG: threonylcarbamoyl-AMP synthase [Betaproteobacteria bacterium]|nr:threonylcarbamoyl-AMP synthase [Betaproteobacteria bacterium]
MAQHFHIHPDNPQARLVRQAVAILRQGGVIAYPTDSCYALGCHIGDADSMRRLRQIRGVDEKHHLTLVCCDLAQVARYARIDNWQFRILRQGTPGGFTFLLPATREVPRRLQHPKRSTIGVRVPEHAVVQALLAELGEPILSATLILPGDDEPLTGAEAIRERLEAQVELVIDSGPCATTPTTVVDLAVDPPEVTRRGMGEPDRLGLT